MKSNPEFTEEAARAAQQNLVILYTKLKPGAQEQCGNAMQSLQKFLALACIVAEQMHKHDAPQEHEEPVHPHAIKKPVK